MLIAEIKKKIDLFRDLKLIRVDGHAGIKGNEMVDKLAKKAIHKKSETG